jgi:hypothetical protein
MDRNGRDARLALTASRQAGAFSFQQAIRAGFPRATISRRLASGAWVRSFVGVYSFGGAPRTELSALWHAILAIGPAAVITHETGALAQGAERLPESPLTFTVPHRWHHRLPGVFVHQIDDLVPWHCTRWRGLPISKPSRCVVELGATQPEAVVGRVLDDLIQLRRTTMVEVSRVFADVLRPGKPGMVTIGRVLDARGDGHVPPASELERLLFGTLEAGGLPAPVRQIVLPGRERGGIRGIADAGYPDAKVLLEADGRRWHLRMAASRQDRERDAQVIRDGWVPLRFLHEQLVDDPAEVCAVVADTRADRLRLLQRAA